MSWLPLATVVNIRYGILINLFFLPSLASQPTAPSPPLLFGWGTTFLPYQRAPLDGIASIVRGGIATVFEVCVCVCLFLIRIALLFWRGRANIYFWHCDLPAFYPPPPPPHTHTHTHTHTYRHTHTHTHLPPSPLSHPLIIDFRLKQFGDGSCMCIRSTRDVCVCGDVCACVFIHASASLHVHSCL